MGLVGWIKRKAVQHEASKFDSPEEARAAVVKALENATMSPKVRQTAAWVGGAFLAGVASAMATSNDPLSMPGLKAALAAGVVAGLSALAALFRQPPSNPDQVGPGLVVQVAKAAEAGNLQPAHVEAINKAATLPAAERDGR